MTIEAPERLQEVPPSPPAEPPQGNGSHPEDSDHPERRGCRSRIIGLFENIPPEIFKGPWGRSRGF